MRFQLNEFQRFIKNLVVMTSSSVINNLLGILIVSHLSEKLTVAGFGKLGFLSSYLIYFSLFTSLGTDLVAIRMIAGKKENAGKVIGALVPLKFFLGVVSFIAALLPMLFIDKLNSYGLVLIVFALPILFAPLQSVNAAMEANKKMEYISFIGILVSSLTFILTKIFINRPEDLIVIGFIGAGLGLFTAILMNIIFVKKFGTIKIHVDFMFFKDFLTKAVVIGFIQIITMFIHHFDIIMLSFMMNDYYVGIYNAAYKAMWLIISFMSMIHSLSTTILFENYKKDLEIFKNYYNKYLKFILFLGLGLTMILIFNAKLFLSIFYNLNIYHQSIFCFQILIISLFFMTVNSPLAIGFYSTNNEKTLLKIVIFQLLCNIVGNAILIPYWGINGAAVATIISEASGLLLYIYFLKKVIDFSILKNLLLSILSTLPLFFFLYFINVSVFIKIPLSLIIYVSSIIAFRGYKILELKEIKYLLFQFNKKDI